MSDLFGQDDIPLDDQIREVERELGARRHVYPRLIDSGKLTRQKADRQMAVMAAVAATLKALKAQRENGL
jgi:hypothetical protein